METNYYNTDDFKHWYSQTEVAIGDQNILFKFWVSEYHNKVDAFIQSFIELFNTLAERNDVDALPPFVPVEQNEIVDSETNEIN